MNEQGKSILELWKEVLKKALKDAKQGPDDREVKDYIFCTKENAKDWITGNSESPGSFIWVCDLLDLSPSAVRREIIGR